MELATQIKKLNYLESMELQISTTSLQTSRKLSPLVRRWSAKVKDQLYTRAVIFSLAPVTDFVSESNDLVVS